MEKLVGGAVLLVLLFLVYATWRWPHKPGSVGPGAAGAFYELLDKDKRAAIEIIVEERTSYRDPEDRDGDLPQLEKPRGDG